MRQFYQHYFTATAKLCWLRWLSVPQRLTMLEELMQWEESFWLLICGHHV